MARPRCVLGVCAVPSGTEADEPPWARQERHERARGNLEHFLKLQKRRGAAQTR